jgi:preprotein translocase subunit SecE
VLKNAAGQTKWNRMTRNKNDKAPAKAKAQTATKKSGMNPLRYLTEVRKEASKVTWTPWSETWVSTVMVFVLSVIAMLFFWGVDSGISWSVQQLLAIGS